MDLTDAVIERARQLGADLVGIAPVERFAGAPRRMSPRGLLPEAQSVVVAAIHHLDAAVELGGEPTPHDMGPYNTQGSAMNPKLDDISFLLARFLEEKGYKTLPIAATNIWRYKGYKDLEVNFAPDLAHRYAAVAAGLGEIGWNGLALTPDFGPRQRLVSVITAAALRPSPMYDGAPLCDRCMECVNTCPTDAFRKEVSKINEVKIGDKIFEFPDTNKWRCAWAENFALDLSLEIPETVNEDVILRNLEKHGQRGGEQGCCLKFCMVPQRRCYEPSYCRAPRRKKATTDSSGPQLVDKIKDICSRHLVDFTAIGQKEDLAKDSSLHPECHLPDVNSVICLGIRLPEGSAANPEVSGSVRRRLDYAAFDVAHHIDISGYSAVSGSRIADDLVARELGLDAKNACFETVLTSAHLPSIREHRRKWKGRLTADKLRAFCEEAGADLVGFFNIDRFEELRRSLEDAGLGPKEEEVAEDKGLMYGPYVPETKRQTVRLKGPDDWLPGAQSVIVLGLHYPHAALDTAKTTPAETTGPYVFAQYETLRLLSDVAYVVVKRLLDADCRATMTSDLTGMASTVRSPRGMLPDTRANLFAALLSGLAYPGVHGCPITPQYGVRQRFAAIVTDLSLPNDPLHAGDIACDACDRPCMEACPTSAIGGEEMALRLQGRTYKISAIDRFACDWAKKYCLSGKEGPEYCGLNVDVPVPETRTGAQIAAALTGVNWGVQKRHLSMVEECIRVCPAHRES